MLPNNMVMIPNSKLALSVVTNYWKRGWHYWSLWVSVTHLTRIG